MEAMRILTDNPSISIVLTDVRMPGTDGIAFMKLAQERFEPDRKLQFVVLTGHASLDLAISALRFNAVDFLSKPAGRRDIIEAVQRAQAAVSAGKSGPIDEMALQLQQLTASLAALATRPSATLPSAKSRSPIDAQYVRSLIRSRRLREKFLPADLFAEPAWDMLLDLTAASLEGKLITVSSLCLAASVPTTTALRWIKHMTDEGLLIRRADDADGRRTWVHLSSETSEAMLSCLDQIRGRLLAA